MWRGKGYDHALSQSLSHARARTHTHSHTESIAVNRQTSVDMHIIIQTVEQTSNGASQTNRCTKRQTYSNAQRMRDWQTYREVDGRVCSPHQTTIHGHLYLSWVLFLPVHSFNYSIAVEPHSRVVLKPLTTARGWWWWSAGDGGGLMMW